MLTGSTEFSMFAAWDAYFGSAEMKAYSAAETNAAKDFAVKYGSDMYRIFNAECSAETMYDHYGADITCAKLTTATPMH